MLNCNLYVFCNKYLNLTLRGRGYDLCTGIGSLALSNCLFISARNFCLDLRHRAHPAVFRVIDVYRVIFYAFIHVIKCLKRLKHHIYRVIFYGFIHVVKCLKRIKHHISSRYIPCHFLSFYSCSKMLTTDKASYKL